MKKTATLGMLLLLGQVLCAQEVPPPNANAQKVPPPNVNASRFAEAPKIDGHLDEAVWQTAGVITGFRQTEPTPGAPATDKTEVLIGYDEDKIYIGARCYTADPSTISSVRMDRDADIGNEDSVYFVFDTFNDGQTGFLFAVNETGAQLDAVVRSDGDDVNWRWNGVWFSGTSRDEEGWTAEIAIPLRNLRFAEKPEHTWGFNVQRLIAHNREYAFWQPPESTLSANAIFKVSQAGHLHGLKGLKPARSWDFMPYVLVRGDKSDALGDDEDFEVGIDVKKNLTSRLTLDLTYNLDFAEAEIDALQINLTRFPLFFPEKRDFFLEGANNFYFGERPDGLRPARNIFFFSRRIGLTRNGRYQIPVLGGAKLSGQLGGVNLGVLALATEELTYRVRTGEECPEPPTSDGDCFEPQTNYSVVRLKKDVREGSSLGLIYLNKAVENGPDNTGMGMDWDVKLNKRLKTGGFLARTESAAGVDDWAGMADLVWESETLFARGSYLEVGERFDPAMGFFQRRGIHEWRGTATNFFHPKKKKMGPVLVLGEISRVVGQDGELESQNGKIELGLHTKNWAGFYLIIYDDTEVLDANFHISPGVVIPPGRYHFTRPFLGWQGPPSKPFFPFLRYEWGEFYDGDFRNFVFGFHTRPRHGLFSRLFYEHTDVEMPYGDFTIDFLSLNVTYAVSPTLSGRSLTEWRKNDSLNANVGVQWEYRPGAALYLVYNEFRDLFDQPGDFSGKKERSLIVKMTFFL